MQRAEFRAAPAHPAWLVGWHKRCKVVPSEDTDRTDVSALSRQSKLVVIGNGMVGQRLLEELTSAAAPWSITVLGEESRPAYDRVQLSSFFSCKTADDLAIAKPDFFARHAIALHLGSKAVAIDRENHRVHCADGHEHAYDALVLATGSYPFVPPIPGRDRPDCFVYR